MQKLNITDPVMIDNINLASAVAVSENAVIEQTNVGYRVSVPAGETLIVIADDFEVIRGISMVGEFVVTIQPPAEPEVDAKARRIAELEAELAALREESGT